MPATRFITGPCKPHVIKQNAKVGQPLFYNKYIEYYLKTDLNKGGLYILANNKKTDVVFESVIWSQMEDDIHPNS